jgi:asparagine synthase (glutamine-hydrolysing)
MYESAHSQGIRVLMDGLDGDTVVNHGLGWLASLAAAGEWTALGEQIRHLGRRHGVSLMRYLDPWVYPPLLRLAREHHWVSFLQAVHQLAPRLDQSRHALLLRTLRRLVAQSPKGSGSRANLDRTSIIDPEFARRIELQERERALRQLPNRRGDTGRIMHADAVEGPIFQYFLEVANNAASIHDIEPSYPFLDRPLVEYCVALPADQKLRDGWTRWILRRSMEGVLPSKVQWRVRKSRLVYNFLRTLRVRDGRVLESSLFEAPTVLDPFVRMDQVRAIYDRFMNDSTKKTRNEDGLMLFQLATLSRWLRLNPVS